MRVLDSRAATFVVLPFIGLTLAGAPSGLMPAPAAAATIHVPADQPTIQAGIDAAAPADIVLVAPGTYTGAGNRDIDFGGKDVELRSEGGAAVTIIDCQASASDNARGMLLQSGESAAAVVNGFTIRNAYRSGTTAPAGFGAGMLISGAGTAPAIEVCVFEDNFAEAGGGAMFCDDHSAPAISMCTFDGNSSNVQGGAVFANADATFTDCTFTGNSSVEKGGAVVCFSTSAPVFIDCGFDGNTSGGGGAVLCAFTSVGDFTGCTFRGNSAVWGAATISADDAVLHFTTCTFAGNQATSTSSFGGVVHCDTGTVTLTGCTLYGNHAPGGCGIGLDGASTATVDHSIIAFGTGSEAVVCGGTSTATLTCTDVFGNAGGDWVGCIAGQAGAGGNLEADPLFCNVGLGDLRLAGSSPCTAANSGGCGLIGALGEGCVNAVEPSSWGAVKSTFAR